MNESPQSEVGHIKGPDGSPLTLADLPSPDTKRWVIRRKAEVVAAVRGGLLSLEEACCRYKLSTQELSSWQFCIDRFGFAGLRTTRIQYYFGRCQATSGIDPLTTPRTDPPHSRAERAASERALR